MNTKRVEFVGSHMTQDVKKALRDEAMKQGTNMSKLVYTTVRDMLKQNGHHLSPEPEAR